MKRVSENTRIDHQDPPLPQRGISAEVRIQFAHGYTKDTRSDTVLDLYSVIRNSKTACPSGKRGSLENYWVPPGQVRILPLSSRTSRFVELVVAT